MRLKIIVIRSVGHFDFFHKMLHYTGTFDIVDNIFISKSFGNILLLYYIILYYKYVLIPTFEDSCRNISKIAKTRKNKITT